MEDMLVKILGKENVFKGELMCKHCTFGIGGRVFFFVMPTTINNLIEVVKYLKTTNTKWKIIGNASNLLFKDEGYDGVVVCTLKIKELHILGSGHALVSAGVMLPYLVGSLACEGFGGVEFLCGIPGSVGGALFMNSGAHGKSMADIVESVTYFNGEKLITNQVQNLSYSYRDSLFKSNPNFVILSCEMKIKKGNKVFILEEIENLKKERSRNQPCGKSAGSVFKKVDGEPAWKLIDGCGLRGRKYGDAEISQKHTNFILNNGNASADDVLALIDIMKNKVYEKYKKLLELEIEIVE